MILRALESGEKEAILFLHNLGIDTDSLKLNFKDENSERDDIKNMMIDLTIDDHLMGEDADGYREEEEEEEEEDEEETEGLDAEREQERLFLLNKQWPEGITNLNIDIIERDGHCFYRSIQHELNDQKISTSIQELRDRNASYVENEWEHREIPGIFGKKQTSGNNSQEDEFVSKEEYISKIKTSLWGGQPEIIAFQSGCLNMLTGSRGLLIDCYCVKGDEIELIHYLPLIKGEERKGRIHVILLYVGDNHFHRMICTDYEHYSSLRLEKETNIYQQSSPLSPSIAVEEEIINNDNYRNANSGSISFTTPSKLNSISVEEDTRTPKVIVIDDDEETDENNTNRFHSGLLTRDPEELLNGLQIANGLEYALRFEERGTFDYIYKYPSKIENTISYFSLRKGRTLRKIQQFKTPEAFIVSLIYEYRSHWVRLQLIVFQLLSLLRTI